MPYIKKIDRQELAAGLLPETPGELNYCLTKFVWSYYKDNEPSYQTINDILGALEGAKLEFYRRVAAPYEDQKRFDNGDVYT